MNVHVPAELIPDGYRLTGEYRYVSVGELYLWSSDGHPIALMHSAGGTPRMAVLLAKIQR